MSDHMQHQTEITVDEVLPGTGLTTQAAVEQFAINWMQGHGKLPRTPATPLVWFFTLSILDPSVLGSKQKRERFRIYAKVVSWSHLDSGSLRSYHASDGRYFHSEVVRRQLLDVEFPSSSNSFLRAAVAGRE
jgi:hypothetical protein